MQADGTHRNVPVPAPQWIWAMGRLANVVSSTSARSRLRGGPACLIKWRTGSCPLGVSRSQLVTGQAAPRKNPSWLFRAASAFGAFGFFVRDGLASAFPRS